MKRKPSKLLTRKSISFFLLGLKNYKGDEPRGDDGDDVDDDGLESIEGEGKKGEKMITKELKWLSATDL